jgi:hypothetical protein
MLAASGARFVTKDFLDILHNILFKSQRSGFECLTELKDVQVLYPDK